MKPLKRGPKPKKESEKKVKLSIWVKKKFAEYAKKDLLLLEQKHSD
jgi:hypothetical protein